MNQDEAAMRRLAHNLTLLREAREAVRALKEAHVPVVVLKGAVLLSLGRSLDTREMMDVDFLLSPANRDRAIEVLQGLGYTPIAMPSRPLGMKAHHAAGLQHPGGTQLDLHTSLSPALRWAVDDAGVMARALPFDLAGGDARRPCDEDLLLHLAINAAKDELARADRLAQDVAALLRSQTLQWETLMDRARRWRCTVALWATLRLSIALAQAPVPSEVLRALRPGFARRAWLRALLDLEQARVWRRPPASRRLRQFMVAGPLTDSPARFALASARFAALRAADAVLERLRSSDRRAEGTSLPSGDKKIT